MSTITEDEIRSKWPLHWLVWNDDDKSLGRLLGEKQNDTELLDPRGRTPLHLAVTLGRVRCADVLLRNNASALAENRHHWSVLNEAVCSGNPELIGLVLRHRDLQQKKITTHDIPLMLEKLQNAPDYYIEMKWEFSSWVPFLSRVCPSDTYKIWKKGTTVRVDTTLIGFQNFSWQRGHQTLIFEATATGHRVCDINHDERNVWEKEFHVSDPDPTQTLMNQEIGVLHRMNSPVVSTYLDTKSIAFQRQKSGIWGFRSEKTEEINGYQAKVFSATGLDILTNTRVEHLPETEKHKQKSLNPLQDFLGAAQDHVSNVPAIEGPDAAAALAASKSGATKSGGEKEAKKLPPRLTMEEYFSPPANEKDYDAIGRPPEVNTRSQKLKATVSLAEDFPLSLREQVMPIIDLMAMNTPHFAKMKDFINLQMPSGFPIKFEIPLFHVMTAKVTFGNLNGTTHPAPHVSLHSEETSVEPDPLPIPSFSDTHDTSPIKHRHVDTHPSTAAAPPSRDPTESSVDVEEGGTSVDAIVRVSAHKTVKKEVCLISDECFKVPVGYRRLNRGGHGMVNEEEELLQLAIKQSLMDQGGGEVSPGDEKLTFAEALKDETMMSSESDPQLQAALKASMGNQSQQPATATTTTSTSTTTTSNTFRGVISAEEEDLELALAISRQMAEEEEKKRRQEEDEELERVLRLSMEDK